MSSNGSLIVYLWLIIVLFVIAIIAIGIAAARVYRRKDATVDGPTNTAPIPDREQSNPVTRRDSPGASSEMGRDGIGNVTPNSDRT
jgi:hypothetical protein